MKISFPINYSGYIPFLRSILFLVKADIISLPQLGFYICFVMQADFDRRHPHYRTILRDDKQLAKEFDLDPTTIYRYRKAFVKAGLLVEERGQTRVPNYFMFELDKVNKLARLPISTLQDLFVKPQEDFAEVELSIANMQNNQPEKAIQSSSFPSKDDSLSADDIDWINKNVKEG